MQTLSLFLSFGSNIHRSHSVFKAAPVCDVYTSNFLRISPFFVRLTQAAVHQTGVSTDAFIDTEV